MELVPVAVVALLVLAYSLVSKRLEDTFITGPMVFVTAGILLGPAGFGLIGEDMSSGALRLLAEATIVLILYTDAIRIDLRLLRSQIGIPARLLGIGLPLTLLLGTLVGWALLDGLQIWDVALLAAVLAPTDAALGQSVVESPAVPIRVRQSINVESGLNDGLMLPIISVFIAFAAVQEGAAEEAWLLFTVRQIGFGVLVGVVSGWVGGQLINRSVERAWMTGVARQLATLAIGVTAFAGAEILEGNGFVAAFVAGLAFGAIARHHGVGAQEFTANEGRLLMLLTFLVFGIAVVGPAVDLPDWRMVLYAIASLTVIRMVPVAISLLGSKLGRPTVWFIGWFGPRGLASILFAVFILDEADLPATDRILEVAALVILLSVFLHGISSHPLAERYGAWFRSMDDPSMPEARDVEPMPIRRMSDRYRR